MRTARDTFLQFLSDNLGLALHAVRREVDNPDAENLRVNAVNIKFTNPDFDNQVADQPVIIDILNEDELTALDWAQQVYNLLSTRCYTPVYDYTNTGSPVSTGSMLYWPRTLRFKEIHSPFYSHLRCRVPLSFHNY